MFQSTCREPCQSLAVSMAWAGPIPGQLAPSKLTPSKLAHDNSPYDSSPHGKLAQWTAHPMDSLPHGQLTPWTAHPMNCSPHEQLGSWTARPMDDPNSKTCTKHTTYVQWQKKSEKFHNIFIHQCLKTARGHDDLKIHISFLTFTFVYKNNLFFLWCWGMHCQKCV
jgi:hypothetical protein